MQEAIVAIILIACIAYIAWRISDSFRRAGDPCRGCSGCALKDLKRRKLSRKERKSCMKAKKAGKSFAG